MVAAGTLCAQSAQQTPTFKTSTALVRIDVQVIDGKRPVAGLRKEDFVLHEQGSPRTIEYFGREAEPLQVILLLDVSGSMGKMLRDMSAMARQALSQLKPADQAGVFLFARQARMDAELNGDTALAEHALREAPLEHGLGAGTSLNDALLRVAAYFKDQPAFAGRRAVIVLTDNGGVHFRVPDEDVVRAFSEVNAVLNAIVPSGARPPNMPSGTGINPDFTPADIFKLAAATGGEVLRSDKAGEQFKEMMERIRLRYSLGIKSAPGAAGTFRSLQVALSDEARRRNPKAEVRARAGYFAQGE